MRTQSHKTSSTSHTTMYGMRNYSVSKNFFLSISWISKVWRNLEKQPPRGVLSTRCSENMKCDFNKVATLLKLSFGMVVLL